MFVLMTSIGAPGEGFMKKVARRGLQLIARSSAISEFFDSGNVRSREALDALVLDGGRYWARTSDLCRVKATLYQLS